MSTPGLRRLHHYIGLIIAPSVLFFSLTGIVQIFGLHEAHGSYRPAAIVERFSSVHKDQVFEQRHKHERPPSPLAGELSPPAAEPSRPAGNDDRTSPVTLALKWFFCSVAVALAVSTVIGIWLGLTQTRPRCVGWTLFIAGWVIPIVLLLS